MCDEESPPAGASLKPAATSIDNNGGYRNPNAVGKGDADATAEASGGPPTPHPFIRSASTVVDEKVDDWVRTSRHRLLADASVNSAPDICRALILYKPVTALPPSVTDGAAPAEGGGGPAIADGEGDDGEGGGDPTPSPQSGGDGGGETAPSAAAAAGLRAMAARGGEQRSAQCAGNSTAEAAGFTGGGERTTGQSHGYASGVTNDHHHANGRHHHHHRVAGSLFGPLPRGLCTAQSGGDDAGGRMLMRNDSSASTLTGGMGSGAMVATRDDGDVGRGRAPAPAASVDAMDMDAAGDEGAGGAGGGGEGDLGSLESEPPQPPVLTRVGTSRGVPTPDLTAERVSWARVRCTVVLHV